MGFVPGFVQCKADSEIIQYLEYLLRKALEGRKKKLKQPKNLSQIQALQLQTIPWGQGRGYEVEIAFKWCPY